MQNGIHLTAEQQLKLIEAYGGIEAWGGPNYQPHFACAWAWAGNTPFQWGKQVASHFGGTRDPMVVRWPKRIKDKGGLRTQFTHCIDVVPTILEAAGIPAPKKVDGIEQMPMHGTSFLYTFDDAKAKSRHTQQYFEIFGNRAMYKDGWIACARLDRIPWRVDPAQLAKFAPGSGWDPDKDKWELYNIDEDFSEANDLAAKHPEKLAELKKLFWEEAEKYHVTPLLGGFALFYGFPLPAAERTKFTYYPGTENIASGMIPSIYNRSYSISADLDIPADGAEGVIVAEADIMGGFSLYVQDGKLHFTYSLMGVKVTTLTSDGQTADRQGRRALRVHRRQARESGHRRQRQAVRQRQAGRGEPFGAYRVRSGSPAIPAWTSARTTATSVSPTYKAKAPFAFTGKIGKVVFDLAPPKQGALEHRRILQERLLRAMRN